jgi:hypothetical protein
MPKIIKNIGYKIGRLLILEDLKKVGPRYHKLYLVKCDCGKILETSIVSINQSCGCAKDGKLSVMDRELSEHLSRLKSRKHLYSDLTTSEMENIIFNDCYYCGAKPSLKMQKGNDLKNTIDRVFNNGGYTYLNCVASCRPCNSGKSDKTVKEFIDLNKKIYNNLLNEK